MGLPPYRPRKDLEHWLDRGNLRMSITAAKGLVADNGGRPLDLATALRFLPLVAEQLDAWALRWLGRWIEQAAEVAALLADLTAEPTTLDALHELV